MDRPCVGGMHRLFALSWPVMKYHDYNRFSSSSSNSTNDISLGKFLLSVTGGKGTRCT